MQSLRQKEDAQMAELVDALDSKSGFRKGVQVRFLFWAHQKLCKSLIYKAFLFCAGQKFVTFLRFLGSNAKLVELKKYSSLLKAKRQQAMRSGAAT